jgi:hypothetical protein
MKRALFVSALLAGISFTTPALARSGNGSVNAKMMTNGDAVMEIQLPPKECYVIDLSMKANHMHCKLEGFPRQSFTKILERGPNV